jgi:DNA polymerase (family 10)
MLSINTDAHSPDELDLIPYGINVARRGWVTKKNVINCMSWDELKKFIARKR